MEKKNADGKNKLMMVIIIALLVILLGTIVAVSFFMLNEMRREPSDEIPTPPPPQVVTLRELDTFNAGDITRNLRLDPGTPGRGWVLQGTFSFEVNVQDDAGAELMNLLHEKIDVVRDILNTVVGNFSHGEITDVNGVDRLREEILDLMSETFQTNRIHQVNISQIVFVPM